MSKICDAKVGYNGQRYEVRAQTESECEEFTVGWTEAADGGSLVRMINKHPSHHSPRVIDLRASSPTEMEK